jgi:hypothetical protein
MKEIQRNRDLVKLYESIPMGTFGAISIKQKISDAEQAVESGDLAAMVSAYQELQKTE